MQLLILSLMPATSLAIKTGSAGGRQIQTPELLASVKPLQPSKAQSAYFKIFKQDALTS